jgi:aminoglycoside 6'-N-acetyltransferase I
MIRAVTRDDFAEWRRMRATLWPDCPLEMHDLEMTEQISSSEFAVFIHERSHGKLGGFIELSVRNRVDGTMSPRVGYVEGWYVDADLRGKGIGRALMARSEAWAKKWASPNWPVTRNWRMTPAYARTARWASVKPFGSCIS